MEWSDVGRARLRVRDDGVAEIQHDAGVLYTRSAAAEHTARVRELLGGRPAPMLVVVGDGFRPDEGARDYLMRSPEIAEVFTAGAILFRRRAEAMAVNLFLKLRRPVCPMKAFADERDALEWLASTRPQKR